MGLSNQTGRLAPHAMLQDRYVILGLAGRGGMGCVYKATDTFLDSRLVAIKEMSQSTLSADKLAEAEERFRLEAEMLGKLSHPNLPRVLNSFTEFGRSYLVMDFIDGQTLLQLLTESSEHRLPVEAILRYAIQLCTVLDYLHTQSPPIIFRDLKPSNVMVTAQGELFLIDFGIARHFTQGKQQDTIPLGSEGFCPPEQFGTGQTSPRSDLYSLGATLHYCLTGKNPRSNKPTLFDFVPIAECNQQVPDDLSKLILWLLATREEQRPESAAQVRQLLQAIEQWTSASTNMTGSRKTGVLQQMRANSGYFYDTKTARAAQSRQWLAHLNVLPGNVGAWCGNVLIPFLALLYGQVEAWRLLFALPLLRCLHELGSDFSRSLFQNNDGRPLFFTRMLTSPLWTPYFFLVFFTLPLLLGLACFGVLHVEHDSLQFMLCCLCVFLLFLLGAMLMGARIRHLYSKRLLLATMLALALLLFSLLSLASVQQILQRMVLNALLSFILLGLALCSFLRPAACFAWIDHLSLTLTIAVYALLQYGFGLKELAWLGTAALPVNNVLVGILGGIALAMALRLRRPFCWGERALLCGISCLCAGLQYTFGLQEIVHVPLLITLFQGRQVDPLNLVTANLLLTAGPVLLTLLWLFLPLAQRSARLARLPLVVLALTGAGLQGFLGLELPPPLATTLPLALPIAKLLTLAQSLSCLLLLLVGVLCLPGLRRQSWLKHGSIFTVSLTCALVQSSAWNRVEHLSLSQQGRPASLLSSSIATLNQPQFYAAASNKLLAQGLVIVVVAALGFTAFLLLARFLGLFSPFRDVFGPGCRFWLSTKGLLAHLERGLLLLVTLICLLLYWFFGNSSFLLHFPTGVFTPGHLLLALLLLATVLLLLHVTYPPGRLEFLVLQLDTLACALLLWPPFAQNSPLQATQHWRMTFFLPPALIAPGLLLLALISLFWFRRPGPRRARLLLQGLLCAALLCTLLQARLPILALLALILLIEGILLALQIERRGGSPLHLSD